MQFVTDFIESVGYMPIVAVAVLLVGGLVYYFYFSSPKNMMALPEMPLMEQMPEEVELSETQPQMLETIPEESA